MRVSSSLSITTALSLVAITMASVPVSAQQPQQKPNILFIMGDDIGWVEDREAAANHPLHERCEPGQHLGELRADDVA